MRSMYAGKKCFYNYNDDAYFGLASCDRKINDHKKGI